MGMFDVPVVKKGGVGSGGRVVPAVSEVGGGPEQECVRLFEWWFECVGRVNKVTLITLIRHCGTCFAALGSGLINTKYATKRELFEASTYV